MAANDGNQINANSQGNAVFETEVRILKDQVLAMGRLVNQQVAIALEALRQLDVNIAHRVLDNADRLVGTMERDINQQCVHLLRSNDAGVHDLHFVAETLKVVTCLDQIGDLAANLAGRIPVLASAAPLPAVSELPDLAAAAQKMVTDVLCAFVAGDGLAAETVLVADAAVDHAAARLVADVQQAMVADPDTVIVGVATIFFIRHIEHIADHAAHIAGRVVSLAQRCIVRHEAAGFADLRVKAGESPWAP